MRSPCWIGLLTLLTALTLNASAHAQFPEPGDTLAPLFAFADNGTYFTYYCDDCTISEFVQYDSSENYPSGLPAGTCDPAVNTVTADFTGLVPPRPKPEKPVAGAAARGARPTKDPVAKGTDVRLIGRFKAMHNTGAGEIKMQLYLWSVKQRMYTDVNGKQRKLPGKVFGTGFVVPSFFKPDGSADDQVPDLEKSQLTLSLVRDRAGALTGDYDITIKGAGQSFRVLKLN